MSVLKHIAASIYRLGLWIHRILYAVGLKRSRPSTIPSIVVGNIQAGGTGKTPMADWLLNELQKHDFNPAYLSRGYKRKSRGYKLLPADADPKIYSDEASMIKGRNPELLVAVSEDRQLGIRELEKLGANIVILDDGMQHRKLRADYYLLMSRADKPFWDDRLLPMGRLREPLAQVSKAQALIIGRTESLDFEGKQNLKLKASQHFKGDIYLSHFNYKEATLKIGEINKSLKNYSICGLANPDDFIEHCKSKYDCVGEFVFPDHHKFKQINLDKAHHRSGVANYFCSDKDWVKLRKFHSWFKYKQMNLYCVSIDLQIENSDLLINSILQDVRKD